jgi:hypothetical protein
METYPKVENCHEIFQKLRPNIKKIIISKHFKKDAPNFNINLILDSEHEYFTRLHKFEETINGNHIFRALKKGNHIVYSINSDTLIFLRAFKNFKTYKKFLDNKQQLKKMIKNIS